MDGGTATSKGFAGKLGAGWEVRAVEDFTGDGKADILTKGPDGTVSVWEMDGNTVTARTYAGKLGEGWEIKEIADFNGDGSLEDPSALATFGVYRGHDRVIYWQEK